MTLTAAQRKKACEYQKTYHGRHPEKRFEYNLKRNYHLTVQQYQDLLTASHGCCAICDRPFDFNKKEPCVDHDHTDGSIRGLLCACCNLALGGFDDNPTRLQRAIDYLT